MNGLLQPEEFDLSLILGLTLQFWAEGRRRRALTFQALYGTYVIYRKVNMRHKIKIRLQNHNQSFSVLGICRTWLSLYRVECTAHEHNAMSPARSLTRTARSRVECTNHETTAHPRYVALEQVKKQRAQRETKTGQGSNPDLFIRRQAH